jgi:hypothetical protein
MSEARFWVSVLVVFGVMSLMFAVMITAVGFGTLVDLPFVWVSAFGFFLLVGGLFKFIDEYFTGSHDEVWVE